LEEHKTLGPSWNIQTEQRLNVPALKWFFFKTLSPIVNSFGLIIKALQRSPELSAKLVVSVEESELILSEHFLKEATWNAVVEPYLERCWLQHSKIIFDETIFDHVFLDCVNDTETQGIETETHLCPISGLTLENTIELGPGLRLRRLLPRDVEVWLNPSWELFGTPPLQTEDIIRSQCALELTYVRPHGYYELTNIIKRIEDLRVETENIIHVLGLSRLITDKDLRIPFTQKSKRGLLNRQIDIALSSAPRISSLGVRHVAIADEVAKDLVRAHKSFSGGSLSGEIRLAFKRWAGAADNWTMPISSSTIGSDLNQCSHKIPRKKYGSEPQCASLPIWGTLRATTK
jgi:hypothetical protein